MVEKHVTSIEQNIVYTLHFLFRAIVVVAFGCCDKTKTKAPWQSDVGEERIYLSLHFLVSLSLGEIKGGTGVGIEVKIMEEPLLTACRLTCSASFS